MNYAGTDQYAQGREAFLAGVDQIHCPFDSVDQYNNFKAWHQGWREAKNGRAAFNPDWKLSPTEGMAVKLSLALYKHVPNWPGATDEQLESVAVEILNDGSENHHG
jgi:ribosome modulation factor